MPFYNELNVPENLQQQACVYRQCKIAWYRYKCTMQHAKHLEIIFAPERYGNTRIVYQITVAHYKSLLFFFFKQRHTVIKFLLNALPSNKTANPGECGTQGCSKEPESTHPKAWIPVRSSETHHSSHKVKIQQALCKIRTNVILNTSFQKSKFHTVLIKPIGQ